MPTPRHLNKAPITEAIIDFRVKARQGLDPQEFGRVKAELKDRFPLVEERRGGQVVFKLAPAGAQPPVVEDLGLQGFLFYSGDKKLLAQFRIDGFTLNRLKPYTRWEQLFPLALELWKIYCSIAEPEFVTRLALRYINHLEIPPDLGDFDFYLRAAPVVPAELPQGVSAFLSRVTIHDPENQLAAHVVQTLQTDPASQKVTLILDIDAFRPGEWSATDPEVESAFMSLRHFKNQVFFNYLTEEALRRYE